MMNDIVKRGGKVFYLYTHAKPDGEIFYVGKGVGDRARDFFRRNKWHSSVCEKYGRQNIVISVYPTIDERHAHAAEALLICSLKRAGIRLCNLTNGGEGEAGRVFTDEHRRRLSEAGRGFKKSEETLQKMRLAGLGRKLTEAHKEKLRGKKLSADHAAALLRAITGRVVSEEQKQKSREKMKGRKLTPEHVEKMRASKIGKKQSAETKEKRSASLRAAHARRRASQSGVQA